MARGLRLEGAVPTFVLHAIGKQAQRASLKLDQIRVGRDPQNDIVLAGRTVSREHAIFLQDQSHRWYVGCVSESNPIIVDNTMVTQSCYLRDGSEVLIGADNLIIFCENDFSAQHQMGQQAAYTTGECLRCHWSGMVSSVRKDPVCPKCGARDVRSASTYTRDEVAAEVDTDATSVMTTEQVKAHLRKIKAAKRSHIERVDGLDDGNARHDLHETETLVLAKGSGGALALKGFVFGGPIVLKWTGAHFQAESAMFWPSMSVNGVKTKTALLNNGDLIEVGPNRFKISTG